MYGKAKKDTSANVERFFQELRLQVFAKQKAVLRKKVSTTSSMICYVELLTKICAAQGFGNL